MVTVLGSSGTPYKVIYDVMDIYTGFDDLLPFKATLEQDHANLLRLANAVTYTAETMLKTCPELQAHKHKVYIPNGVAMNEWIVA